MKKSLFIFILLSVFANAQINRFYYDYQFVPDINQKDTIKKTMMYLDITESGSKYYSHQKYVQDSTINADLQKNLIRRSGEMKITHNASAKDVTYSVEKSYPDFQVYLIEGISLEQYKIKETDPIVWKILADTEKIGEYETQKATTSFGGRNWTAWFAKELPFQDGPYKFHGLPGLIVKMEDETKTHTMTMVANKKTKENTAFKEMKADGINLSFLGIGSKTPIEITKDKFKKLRQEYLADPAKGLKMMMSNLGNNVSVKMTSVNGREMPDMNQAYRRMEQSVKEKEAKDNNRIEPSLYSK